MSSTSAETPSFAGSSLLRQSPPFRPPSHTGPGGADLSLSELYISDSSEECTLSKPFSLLPRRDTQDKGPGHDEDQPVLDQGDLMDKAVDDGEVMMDKGKRSLNEARTREERLQHDLFVLKKLNASFSFYNEALNDARTSSENVALQLDRTGSLLDQYANLLRHTENNSNLIFDETWEGGEADRQMVDRLRVEATKRAKREQEEREEASRREQERLEREEQDQKARELREAKEREKRSSSGLVRGVRVVRGLRARGTERGASTATRGRIPSATAGGGSVASSRGSTVSRGGRRS